MKPEYLELLTKEKVIKTKYGQEVTVYELVTCDDEEILNAWAKHLREHYCVESEIDIFRVGYGLGRSQYLEQIKFPSGSIKPGPSTRSGDFTEILVADYVQYVLNYFVPRTRYDRKVNRNSSTMGSDLIGYKYGEKISQDDELIIFEVKSASSETIPQKSILQKAIDDSNKDVLRLAESLNAIVQRLIDRQEYEEAIRVQRFQNSTDNSYIKVYGAAAVHSNTSFSEDAIQIVSTQNHIDPDMILIAIHSEGLMQFIHRMYKRACQC